MNKRVAADLIVLFHHGIEHNRRADLAIGFNLDFILELEHFPGIQPLILILLKALIDKSAKNGIEFRGISF